VGGLSQATAGSGHGARAGVPAVVQVVSRLRCGCNGTRAMMLVVEVLQHGAMPVTAFSADCHECRLAAVLPRDVWLCTRCCGC